jgi:DNA repair protein RecN (Recombination protein N)
MIKYQLSDLTKLSFKEGEEEKLMERGKLLKNSEKINKAVNAATNVLREGNNNASDAVYDAITALRSIEGIIDEAPELLERLESVKCEIDDISETVSSFGENAEGSEYELDRIESRLHAISALKRKYQKDYNGLLELIEELKEELEVLKDSENNIKKIKAKCTGFEKLCEEEAKRITAVRQNACTQLENSVKKHLEGLNMPAFRFKIKLSPKELSNDGGDKIEFLISANAGEEFKSLEKTASGGELSRFMLALKSAFSESDEVSSMVFDEIDTGISGQTSEKLGIKLKSLSRSGKQVICVTHSAQIAALADNHFLVSKEEKDGRTTSKTKLLTDEERIEEISRIMGGIQITENVYSAAKEMLELGKK